MTLKRKVTDLSTVDEKYRDLYTEKKEKDATVYLLTEIEGHDAPDILRTVRGEAATLRTANTKFKEQLAAFEGLDIEAVTGALAENESLKTEVAALKEGKPATGKAFDDAVAAKIKAATGPLETKVKKLETERDTFKVKTEELTKFQTQRVIDDEVVGAFRTLKVDDDVFTRKGDDPDDLPDGLLWARSKFKISEDGKVVDKNGLTPKDLLEQMKDGGQRGHWFGSTGGTGSVPNGPDGKTVSNPWMPGAGWNPTAQSAIQEKDPQRAVALATAAGCPDVDAPFHPKDGTMREFSRY
jgi:hypothetical protein